MGYFTSGLGILVAILSGMLWLADRKNDELNKQLGASVQATNLAIHANETIKQTLQVCKEVNEHNATQRDSAELRAEQAQGRVRVLAQMLEAQINEIEPTDQTCRTLSDPLPDAFIDQLCVNNSNCGD